MPEQSNVSISLPQGGGAIKGLGEKFSPDLFTGTGNYSVPLTLPPGRNGFQPDLSLVYSTGNGNSAFGLGWALSIPGITRKTSHGIPRYNDSHNNPDERDVFILSGVEDLVPVDNGQDWYQYRPRTEGLFALIKHHHSTDQNYWEVKSKDGLISLYGTKRPDNAPAGWKDPAIIADPDNPEHVFSWKLTETRDPYGNRILYEYVRHRRNESHHNWDQIYLQRIRYVEYLDSNDFEQFLITIDFEYDQSQRTDPFSEYRSGFEIRTTWRCKHIKAYTHAESQKLFRQYELVYLDEHPSPQDPLPLNNVSLLSQLIVSGHDPDQPNAMQTEIFPPLEFSYTHFKPDRRDLLAVQGPLPTQSLNDPNLEFVDLFGNGLPDILDTVNMRYWRNLGKGHFDMPRQMKNAPAGFSLDDPETQLLDADGDGRVDLFISSTHICGYFPLRFDGMWDKSAFKHYKLAPSFNLKDPEVKMVDLTGNSITDAIRSGSRMECYFHDPDKGWHSERFLERGALEDFPNVNFSDPRVRMADMSGDGMQDIVLVHDGNIEYYPNLGHGDWGKRIPMKNSPRFPYGYNPEQILIGDVDGDGLADIVYVDHGRILLWINHSGNGWSPVPKIIKGTPSVSNFDALRLVDLLGTGVAVILWSSGATMPGRQHTYFLDFTNGLKPYLLNTINNNMGAVTTVEYTSSIQYYLEDEKKRQTRWKTPLPFPVQVVSSVEAYDHFSQGKLTTRYKYHHGYWDGAEREFRGFGRVDQLDTEAFDHDHAANTQQDEYFTPPIETRNWFHQGPVGDEFGEWQETDYSNEYWSGDEQILKQFDTVSDFLNSNSIKKRRDRRDALRVLRGSNLRSEVYALDGSQYEQRPYTVSESLYGISIPDGTEQCPQPIFFPYGIAQRITQWERGYEPMTQFAFTGEYDQFGQAQQQIQLACPRGWRHLDDEPDIPYLATYTDTKFAHPNDNQIYIHDRVARITQYEIINSGNLTIENLINISEQPMEIIGQSLSYYDGDAFQGEAFEKVGKYGAIVRSETLILTEEILNKVFTGSHQGEVLAYLDTNGAVNWPKEYPQAFRDKLDPLAGYVFHSGGPNDEGKRGYFISTSQQYDFQITPANACGLLTVNRDALGYETVIEYDTFQLLPVKVTDPASLTTQAEYDYRLLQPKLITDPNHNRTCNIYSPLGLLQATAIMGKDGANEGDSLQVPGTRFEYDLLAYDQRRQPVYVRTIRRIYHSNDTDAPPGNRNDTIETIEYSDGFGRLLQTRTQAEDIIYGDTQFGDAGLPPDQTAARQNAVGRQACQGNPPHVVVSGWQVYNNKGLVVEKYEPFFDCGWEYEPPQDRQLGQRVSMFYDPRGQVVRTLNPDGSEQRVIYGKPRELSTPEEFLPSPWDVYTYDENDNAGRTHATSAHAYEHHWNTPSSVILDAMGRAIKSTERNGSDPAQDWYTTETFYDIRGNVVKVKDQKEREAFNYVYDLSPRDDNDEEDEGPQVWRIWNFDAGIRQVVFDVLGNEIERRDSKGAVILQNYDKLGRPIDVWARDNANDTITLREHLLYGDSAEANLSEDQLNAGNLRGALFLHYDEAGLLFFPAYDFKGNLLEKSRQVIADNHLLEIFEQPPQDWKIKPFRVDWMPPDNHTMADRAHTLLNKSLYQTSMAFDGLNRMVSMQYPEDVERRRKTLIPYYNKAGALERIEVDGTTYVQNIAYNAKGQRTLIVYGNSIMTRYAYDKKTFRLLRLCTEKCNSQADGIFQPVGAPLQDFAYDYDRVGNILTIHDRASGCGVPNTILGLNALDRKFTYDPIYRLKSATGREQKRGRATVPWADIPQIPNGQDPSQTRSYQETYIYDSTGNIESLSHHADNKGFTRHFSLVPGTNRLQKMKAAGASYAYHYDVNGNMTGENSSRHFEWDHSDQMHAFRTQTDFTEPSVHAQYLYDSEGQRVMKLIRKQGGDYEVRVYIDALFEHYRWEQSGNLVTQNHNNVLHVMDDQQRITLLRVGPSHPKDTGPNVQYQLGDHLGSSNIVVNENGNWINKEEYTPYGETSFGSFSKKRYRFIGMERDEETGLNCHGLRYYAYWLGKWISIDSAGPVEHKNLYCYGRNNPVVFKDTNGLQSNNSTQEKKHQSRVTGVRVYVEEVSYPGMPALHTFIRVTTKSEDVVIELYGAGDGHITGRPQVTPYSDSTLSRGNKMVSELVGAIERPESVSNDDRFERRIIELARFFQSKQRGKFHMLPPYNKWGPNCNGYIRALIELSGGRVGFPMWAVGNQEMSAYEKSLESKYGQMLNASEETRRKARAGLKPVLIPPIADNDKERRRIIFDWVQGKIIRQGLEKVGKWWFKLKFGKNIPVPLYPY